MGEHLILERYYWFDRQVNAKRFPNAGSLARHFEISTKTAQRAIEFMRDRLQAPLEYDSKNKGYRYTDDSFVLPPFHVSQGELVSILLARNLLSESAGGLISNHIQTFGKKLLSSIGEIGFTEDKLRHAFSAVWNGHSPAPPEIFQSVITALLENRLLTLTYDSPVSEQKTPRTLEPHHLQHYMGSWVLIGWCRLRSDWRKFFLSRMSELQVSNIPFNPRSEMEWKKLIQSSFGIFQGGETVAVTLQFNAFRAPWIREQVWHSDQVIKELPNGGVRLSLPVSDLREIKMRVLQFGADVEVLEPVDLRDEVRREIEKMSDIYGKN